METVRRLRERFPKLQDPPSDDICYATQNRQLAVKQMAPECDLVFVVGSSNSSNSVRLVEVAVEHGAQAGYLVDYADEIDEAWLDGVSTRRHVRGERSEVLVRDVLNYLADRGFGEAETVVAAEESLLFALRPSCAATSRPGRASPTRSGTTRPAWRPAPCAESLAPASRSPSRGNAYDRLPSLSASNDDRR